MTTLDEAVSLRLTRIQMGRDWQANVTCLFHYQLEKEHGTCLASHEQK